jgi:hypothetical protein
MESAGNGTTIWSRAKRPPVIDLNAPVGNGYGITELLNALIMGGVAGYQLQAIAYGNGRDHRVTAANGAANAVEVAGDRAGQVGGV